MIASSSRSRLAASLALVALLAACQRRPSQDVVVGNGRHVDVVAVAPNVGALRMIDPALAMDTTLVVHYYQGQSDADSANAEREDVLAWATPQAERMGMRHVLLQRTEHTYGRWLPFVRHGMTLFTRDTSGAWERHRRGAARASR
jgi:hypothetical protein